jgi:small conductance mechanosensitive channel
MFNIIFLGRENRMKKCGKYIFAFIVLVVVLCYSNSFSQEADKGYTASTVNDPNIPVEVLKELLRPLTKDELIVEANAWQKLLENKYIEINLLEHPKWAIKGSVETPEDSNAVLQKKVLVTTNKLREQKTGLLDRFDAVVEALRLKGGDIDSYLKYAAQVSGLGITTDSFSAIKTKLTGWLTSSQGGLRWLKNIVFFIITMIIASVLAGMVAGITKKAISKSKKCSDLLKHFFVNAAHKAVLIFGFVMALTMLEFNIAPIIAGLGVAGFVLGFALQGTLSNFASGLMILIYRPYDIGQIIEAAGVTGIVHTMNLVSTTIKTFDNQIIIVPNGSIWGGVIKNVTGSDTRRVDMTFGISYDDDISKAERVLNDIVSSHKLVLKAPETVIKLNELADSSVNFICRPWVKTADYWTVYWDITREVKERFDREGITVPYPQQDIHIHKAD